MCVCVCVCVCVLLQLGWIYGSVTEDILTGFKMHCRGWRSIYCMPRRPAFKGSAPINLSDRLNQVLRWALGSVEILFSRHCPLWYGYKGGNLKCLERLAYINTTVYPLTALPLVAYCTLPAICLLTGKFIIPTVCSTPPPSPKPPFLFFSLPHEKFITIISVFLIQNFKFLEDLKTLKFFVFTFWVVLDVFCKFHVS